MPRASMQNLVSEQTTSGSSSSSKNDAVSSKGRGKVTSSYGNSNTKSSKKKRKKNCNKLKGIKRVKCILAKKSKSKGKGPVGPNLL